MQEFDQFLVRIQILLCRYNFSYISQTFEYSVKFFEAAYQLACHGFFFILHQLFLCFLLLLSTVALCIHILRYFCVYFCSYSNPLITETCTDLMNHFYMFFFKCLQLSHLRSEVRNVWFRNWYFLGDFKGSGWPL